GDDREAILARQHHVEDDEVERRCGLADQALDGGLAGLDDRGFVAFGLEVEPQPIGEMLFVLDNQDAGHHWAASPALGSINVNVLPCPAPRLSANARPPCFFATDRTMKSPSPLPFVRAATLAGIR